MKRSLIVILTLALCCDMAFCQTELSWPSGWLHYPFSGVGAGVSRDSLPPHVRCLCRGTHTLILGTTYPWFGHKEETEITLRIKYKTDEWIETAYVVLAGMDEREDMAHSDTIRLPLSDDWRELTFRRTLRPAAFFLPTIETRAKPNRPLWTGILSLADVQLSENGRELPRDVPSYEAPFIESEAVMRLDRMYSQPIMDTRILAIGESAHGTETFENMAFNIMKESIMHHGCNLVMLELPLYDMLYVNRYVKNDGRFALSHIRDRLEYKQVSDSLLSFVNWVREYNSRHDNRVSFLGCDVAYNMMNYLSLFEFLFCLNDKRHEAADSLCVRVRGPKYKPEEIYSMLDSACMIPDFMTDEEAAMVRCCVMNLSASNDTIDRDLRLNHTTQLILDLYGDTVKATLWAHVGHVAYSNTCRSTGGTFFLKGVYPMGRHLKERYQDDYKCMALIGLEGEVKFFDRPEPRIMAMQPPKKSSLEWQLSYHSVVPIYMQTNCLSPDAAYLMRHVGANYSPNQFAYVFPHSAFDGVVWVQTVKPLGKTPNVPRDPDGYILNKWIESYKKLPPFKGWKLRGE